MGKIKFHTTPNFGSLYPLDLSKNIEELHWGARSIESQWNSATSPYNTGNLEIHAHLLPTVDAVDFVNAMQEGEYWEIDGVCLALKGEKKIRINSDFSPLLLKNTSDLFELCGLGLESDLKNLVRDWSARALSEEERAAWAVQGVFVSGPMERIYLSPGAKLRSCNLNTENGPIVLGPNSEVMEGASIRGSFSLGEGSSVRMGATIYGPTSIGSQCKVGGEISNCVIHDFSNKAHHGFIGNSVLGSWCNLGAGTTSSNLKNNYSEIRVWSKEEKGFNNSGKIFHGLIMGDHSKSSINTTFNTGAVVGAFCNIHGGGIVDKHMPSFSWGNKAGETVYALDKAIETAAKVMSRRNVKMSDSYRKSAESLFEETESDRKV